MHGFSGIYHTRACLVSLQKNIPSPTLMNPNSHISHTTISPCVDLSGHNNMVIEDLDTVTTERLVLLVMRKHMPISLTEFST